MTADKEQVLRGLKRDQILARLTGCKNFVGKRKKFIFTAFVTIRYDTIR